MDAKTNKDRLLRGIRCLQLIQRTNAPNSTLAKAVTKALAPLLEEMANQPEHPDLGQGGKPAAPPVS